MAQQFKNMNELVEYLGTLEERMKTLEEKTVLCAPSSQKAKSMGI